MSSPPTDATGSGAAARDGVLASALATIALVAAGMLGPSGALAAGAARASLPAIERQVMCVTCKIPLQVAESRQADLERAYIQGLIDRGEDEAQIKRALVGQYGPTVLALPGAHGFDLTVYVVPVAVVLALAGLALLLLPRWRSRARERAGAGAATGPRALSPADAARLESDLARFD